MRLVVPLMSEAPDRTPLLAVEDLSVTFPGRHWTWSGRSAGTVALDHVSVTLGEREIVGIVGESGCGKTTLARTVAGLQKATGGRLFLRGREIALNKGPVREIQYLHQDAAGALDPWWTIGSSLNEAVRLSGNRRADAQQDILSILNEVKLVPDVLRRYPHELSGGQVRRVALARVLLAAPSVLILDEPTAGLDLSVQASVLQLMREVQAARGMSLLVVSHDIAVIRILCSRIYVMYQGRPVESGLTQTVLENPQHPYTRLLIDAVPRLETQSSGTRDWQSAETPAQKADV